MRSLDRSCQEYDLLRVGDIVTSDTCCNSCVCFRVRLYTSCSGCLLDPLPGSSPDAHRSLQSVVFESHHNFTHHLEVRVSPCFPSFHSPCLLARSYLARSFTFCTRALSQPALAAYSSTYTANAVSTSHGRRDHHPCPGTPARRHLGPACFRQRQDSGAYRLRTRSLTAV